MKQIEAQEMKLEKYLLITEGTLLIPFSQRPYEWEKAQVERLFNDLTGLYGIDDEIHMLNFFTLSGEDDDINIFDGQQRTVTILLLLAVFIKKLDELNMSEAAGQFHSSYITETNYRTTPPSIKRKLKFGEAEINELFNDLVSRSMKDEYDPADYKNRTMNTLVKNYNLLIKLLDQFIADNNLKADEVLELINDILEKTTLIRIKTSTHELAMAMFETLNNTGKKLENFYVLKNDLVITLTEEEVRTKWSTIESNLEGYDPSQFLVAFATIMTGKSSSQNTLSRLYKKFDRSSFESMNDLLEKILDASEKYLQIRNPAQLQRPQIKEDETKYKELSSHISMFGVKQHHPLLLALFMRKKPLKEINEIMAIILNLIIRNFYFNEERANTIEKPIAELAENVYNQDISLVSIKDRLIRMTIDDNELKTAIKQKEVSSSAAKKRLKFILRETYNKYDLNKEVEIKKGLDEIHYEHILPQNPTKDSRWLKDFPNEDERVKYIRKVGNATLLLNKLNRGIGNKDFSHKKEQYKNSKIPENKVISENNRWNKDSIDNRAERLSNKIISYLDDLTNT